MALPQEKTPSRKGTLPRKKKSALTPTDRFVLRMPKVCNTIEAMLQLDKHTLIFNPPFEMPSVQEERV